jgi:hypothetical protein
VPRRSESQGTSRREPRAPRVDARRDLEVLKGLVERERASSRSLSSLRRRAERAEYDRLPSPLLRRPQYWQRPEAPSATTLGNAPTRAHIGEALGQRLARVQKRHAGPLGCRTSCRCSAEYGKLGSRKMYSLEPRRTHGLRSVVRSNNGKSRVLYVPSSPGASASRSRGRSRLPLMSTRSANTPVPTFAGQVSNPVAFVPGGVDRSR